MSQLNFAELKQRISIVQGAKMLGLSLREDGNSLRTACPACKGDERSLSLLEECNTFKCFHANEYGSVLDLVSHIKGLNLRESAQWLNEKENEEWLDEYADADPSEPDPPKEPSLKPLEKLPKLDSEHVEVKALGFSDGVASEVGIGFASAGLMRGFIAFPVYSNGEIIGYVGVPKGTALKLPKNLGVKS